MNMYVTQNIHPRIECFFLNYAEFPALIDSSTFNLLQYFNFQSLSLAPLLRVSAKSTRVDRTDAT